MVTKPGSVLLREGTRTGLDYCSEHSRLRHLRGFRPALDGDCLRSRRLDAGTIGDSHFRWRSARGIFRSHLFSDHSSFLRQCTDLHTGWTDHSLLDCTDGRRLALGRTVACSRSALLRMALVLRAIGRRLPFQAIDFAFSSRVCDLRRASAARAALVPAAAAICGGGSGRVPVHHFADLDLEHPAWLADLGSYAGASGTAWGRPGRQRKFASAPPHALLRFGRRSNWRCRTRRIGFNDCRNRSRMAAPIPRFAQVAGTSLALVLRLAQCFLLSRPELREAGDGWMAVPFLHTTHCAAWGPGGR